MERPIPVSYTHLLAADELNALLNIADEGDTPAGSLHLTLATSAPLNALFDPILSVVTVSYTHLDVYKRQAAAGNRFGFVMPCPLRYARILSNV